MRARNIFVVILTLSYSCHGHSGQEILTDKTGNLVIPPTQGLKGRANKLYEENDYSNAVLCFDTLIQEDSTNGEYYYKRAYSYGQLFKKKQAIEDFKRSVRFHFRVTPSYFNIGIYSSFENDSAALYYFKKCLETDPSYPNAYKELRECENRLKIRQAPVLEKKTIF